MKRWKASALVAALASLCWASPPTSGSAASASEPATLRAWTVSDQIERTTLDSFNAAGSSSALSPDGGLIQFVTSRPHLAANSVEFALSIYDVPGMRRALDRGTDLNAALIGTVRLVSASSCPAIDSVRWIEIREIAFLGCEGTSAPQVYSYDIRARRLRQETHAPLGAFAFDMNGEALVFLERTRVAHFSERLRQPGILFPENVGDYPVRHFFDLMHDNPYEAEFSTSFRLGSRPPQRVGSRLVSFSPHYRYFLSPDGRKAVIVAPLPEQQVPDVWRAYSERGQPPPEHRELWAQFFLLDLTTGTVSAPIAAPTAEVIYAHANLNAATKAIWDQDSRYVLVSNTAVPINDTEQHLHVPYAVVLDTVDGTFTLGPPLAPEDNAAIGTDRRASFASYPADVSWRGVGNPVEVRYRDGRTRPFDLSLATWGDWALAAVHGERRVELGNSYYVARREDANTPPNLFAGIEGGLERPLTNLNPQFTRLQTAHVETFHWESAGVTWTGGFLEPTAGCAQDCPLVIQIARWTPDEFLPEGSTPNAFAAQVLASNGIAVLQINIGDAIRPDWRFLEEGARLNQAMADAVDVLSSRALVDPSRVGLVGFSRGARHVKYAITHPTRIRWAAAKTSDGGDYGYLSYLFYAAGLGVFRDDIERTYGGTFWAERETWIEQSSAFNVDRITTPLMLEPHGVGNLLMDWEYYAGLVLLERPVEVALVATNEHWMAQPQHLAFSQQTSVDWFRFWLQNYEDPVAAKAEQYRRWRLLRNMQPRVLP